MNRIPNILPHIDEAIDKLNARLDLLAGLQPGWQDDEDLAPSPKAIQSARKIITVLYELGCNPFSVYPTPDGGIQVEQDHHLPDRVCAASTDIEFHSDGVVAAQFICDKNADDPELTLDPRDGWNHPEMANEIFYWQQELLKTLV